MSLHNGSLKLLNISYNNGWTYDPNIKGWWHVCPPHINWPRLSWWKKQHSSHGKQWVSKRFIWLRRSTTNNKMILEKCRITSRNLSTIRTDYYIVFDSMQHSWILKALDMFKVYRVIVKFLKYTLDIWKATLHLNHTKCTSNCLNNRWGIFHGNPFFTFWPSSPFHMN